MANVSIERQCRDKMATEVGKNFVDKMCHFADYHARGRWIPPRLF
jgi:hypothetical protein